MSNPPAHEMAETSWPRNTSSSSSTTSTTALPRKPSVSPSTAPPTRSTCRPRTPRSSATPWPTTSRTRASPPAAPRSVAAAGAPRRPRNGRGDREQTQAIREWARTNGHKIGDKGRIPAHILEAYNARADTGRRRTGPDHARARSASRCAAASVSGGAQAARCSAGTPRSGAQASGAAAGPARGARSAAAACGRRRARRSSLRNEWPAPRVLLDVVLDVVVGQRPLELRGHAAHRHVLAAVAGHDRAGGRRAPSRVLRAAPRSSARRRRSRWWPPRARTRRPCRSR